MDNYPKIYLYRRIVQAKLYIDKNFSGQLDLNNISGEAYYSKFHFARLFKEIYNQSPRQYLISVRIENAKELLHAKIPVTQVCQDVGFESLSSFSGLFKKLTGLSPSQYQLQYQLLQASIKAEPLKHIPACFADSNGWSKNSKIQEVS